MEPYMANIVCKRCFLFKVIIKKTKVNGGCVGTILSYKMVLYQNCRDGYHIMKFNGVNVKVEGEIDDINRARYRYDREGGVNWRR